MADDTRRLAAADLKAPHSKVALPDELGVRGKKQTKATYRTAPTPDRAWEWRGVPTSAHRRELGERLEGSRRLRKTESPPSDSAPSLRGLPTPCRITNPQSRLDTINNSHRSFTVKRLVTLLGQDICANLDRSSQSPDDVVDGTVIPFLSRRDWDGDDE